MSEAQIHRCLDRTRSDHNTSTGSPITWTQACHDARKFCGRSDFCETTHLEQCRASIYVSTTRSSTKTHKSLELTNQHSTHGQDDMHFTNKLVYTATTTHIRTLGWTGTLMVEETKHFRADCITNTLTFLDNMDTCTEKRNHNWYAPLGTQSSI